MFKLPSKHNHAGYMIFDEDFACCSKCEQAWELDVPEEGFPRWVPLIGGKRMPTQWENQGAEQG